MAGRGGAAHSGYHCFRCRIRLHLTVRDGNGTIVTSVGRGGTRPEIGAIASTAIPARRTVPSWYCVTRAEDTREAASAFIQGHAEDDDDDGDGDDDVCTKFFRILDASLEEGLSDGVNDLAIGDDDGDDSADRMPRKLDNAITLKSHDIQTFASGLVADSSDPSSRLLDDDDDNGDDDPQQSDIQAFYANMIDASDYLKARSERERRKARQKQMRERVEEEERKRAIEDSMRMIEDDGAGGMVGTAAAAETRRARTWRRSRPHRTTPRTSAFRPSTSPIARAAVRPCSPTPTLPSRLGGGTVSWAGTDAGRRCYVTCYWAGWATAPSLLRWAREWSRRRSRRDGARISY